MAGLKDKLAFYHPPFDQFRFPGTSQLEIAEARIRTLLGSYEPKAPDLLELQKIYESALREFRQSALSRLSRKAFRFVPWCLFQDLDEGRRSLASYPGFLSSWLSSVEVLRDDIALLNLLHVYFMHYPDSSQTQWRDRTVRCLWQGLQQARGVRAKRWLERVKSHELLFKDAHTRFAQRLNQHRDAQLLLVEAGFGGGLFQSRFIECVMLHWLELLGFAYANSESDLVKRTETLLGLMRDAHGHFLFQSMRREAANYLLSPWSGVAIDPELKALLKGFFLSQLGDPRFHQGGWQGVESQARNVMMGWLVENTVADFFAFIDETSRRDEQSARHWHYRRAFWSAYLKGGYITDAWVAFGSGARNTISYQFRGKPFPYADLRGAQSMHASLILRIGGLVVTEWSHSGRYRVWRENDPSAPEFYRKLYSQYDLIRSPFKEGAHHGSEWGNWQQTLSEIIYQETSIQISFKDLMP